MGPFNNALLLHGLIQSSPSLVSVTLYPDWGLVLMLTFSCDQTEETHLLGWQTAGWVMTDDECGENWEIQYIYLSLSSVKIESFCSISTLFWMWETDQCASLQGSDLLYIYWGPSASSDQSDHKCVHPATAGHLISLLCPINLYIEPPTSHWHWLYS